MDFCKSLFVKIITECFCQCLLDFKFGTLLNISQGNRSVSLILPPGKCSVSICQLPLEVALPVLININMTNTKSLFRGVLYSSSHAGFLSPDRHCFLQFMNGNICHFIFIDCLNKPSLLLKNDKCHITHITDAVNSAFDYRLPGSGDYYLRVPPRC